MVMWSQGISGAGFSFVSTPEAALEGNMESRCGKKARVEACVEQEGDGRAGRQILITAMLE